jgi:hypothetical protein
MTTCGVLILDAQRWGIRSGGVEFTPDSLGCAAEQRPFSERGDESFAAQPFQGMPFNRVGAIGRLTRKHVKSPGGAVPK